MLRFLRLRSPARVRRPATYHFEASQASKRRVTNVSASGFDIGFVGGVVGSTPCRASRPSAVGLFIVCRKRRICFLVVQTLMTISYSLLALHQIPLYTR